MEPGFVHDDFFRFERAPLGCFLTHAIGRVFNSTQLNFSLSPPPSSRQCQRHRKRDLAAYDDHINEGVQNQAGHSTDLNLYHSGPAIFNGRANKRTTGGLLLGFISLSIFTYFFSRFLFPLFNSPTVHGVSDGESRSYFVVFLVFFLLSCLFFLLGVS